MTKWLPTTPMAAMVAALAWLPGVAPAPYEVPVVQAHVPSWVAARDCVRHDLMASWGTTPSPEVAVSELIACRSHRPGAVKGAIASYHLGAEALAGSDPEVALDVFAWTVGLRQGSIVEQMVGLTLADEALTVLEDAPESLRPRIAEVLAATQPLSMVGERRAMRALAADGRLGLGESWFVSRMQRHCERVSSSVDLALSVPAPERQAAVEEVLAADPRWRTMGPLGLLTEQGQHAWWVATHGQVLRDAVAVDLRVAQRARRLVTTPPARP